MGSGASQKFPDMSVKKEAHVLIVASPAQTQVNILLQLLHHLARKYPGITVTVVSSKEQVARFESIRGRGDLASLNLRYEGVFASDSVNRVKDSKFPFRRADQDKLDAESLRKELLADKDAPGAPTCIISSKFQYWSAGWASDLGIPWYPVYPSPQYALAVLEMPKLGDANLKPGTLLSNAIPGVVPSRYLSFVYANDLSSSFNEDRETINKAAQSIKGASAILINSSLGLDFQGQTVEGLRVGMQSSRVLTIGPILEYPGFGFNLTNSTDSCCSDWLDSQHENSVLYVAFGTAIAMSNAAILDIATGLEASGVPFLWVLRLGSRKLSEVLPPGFADRTKGRGKIETSFVPQSKILSHPSIGGFLSHAGWNSLMEALCAGVPLIAWPMGADQHMNARYVVDVAKICHSISDFKAENKLTFEDIGSREIEKAVRHVMLEEKAGDVRRNMKAMQKVIAADMAEGGSSYQNLHAFLDEIANP